MIVRDYGSKLFLLFVFSMVGMVYCNAQSGKSLPVRKVMCTASPEGGAVPSLLDGNGIEFQPLDVVNWKDYPYKPEVSFRIAHTGREILLVWNSSYLPKVTTAITISNVTAPAGC